MQRAETCQEKEYRRSLHDGARIVGVGEAGVTEEGDRPMRTSTYPAAPTPIAQSAKARRYGDAPLGPW